MTLDVDALGSLKVKELQRELKKRGLDTGGLKAALLERLKAHLQEEAAGAEQEQETEKEEEGDKKEENEGEDSTEKEKEQEKEKEKEEKEKEQQQVDTSEKERALAEAVEVEDEAAVNGAETGEKLEKAAGVKRGADKMENGGEGDAPDVKKAKVSEDTEDASPQPEDDDGGGGKPASADANADIGVDVGAAGGEHAGDRATESTETEQRLTLRINNFVRPFTLNAVKALVQEFGDFVEDGFWMDAIKTHCFVTYPSSEIAEKTRSALSGKVWPPENGRSLKVELVDHTAMEVSKFGEANLPSRPKSKGDTSTQSTQRQNVTIDEFFQKTETKPVLYYLPLTDEQVKERKERQSQQPDAPPRKRRHRGGRKRNRRGRFQRR